MNLLKYVSTFAIMVFLVIFFNNGMAYVFKNASATSATDQCQDKMPSSSSSPANTYDFSDESSINDYYTQSQTSYDDYSKCISDYQKSQNDKMATAEKTGVIRAISVFILLVIISVALFKRYPYYSAALIGGGLIFSLIYPNIVRYGAIINTYTQVNADLASQLNMLKAILSLVAIIVITVADMLFFERHINENSSTQKTS